MDEYFMVSFAGGDDRPIYVIPATSIDRIKELYPAALRVAGIKKQEFMILCDRMTHKEHST